MALYFGPNTDQMIEDSLSPDVISAAITYVQKKFPRKTIDASNVVEEFIEIMKYKGFPNMTLKSCVNVYKKMFTLKFNRQILIDTYNIWLGGSRVLVANRTQRGGKDVVICKTNSRDKFFTFSGEQLSMATRNSTPYEYKRSAHYTDFINQNYTCSADEVLWIKIALKRSKKLQGYMRLLDKTTGLPSKTTISPDNRSLIIQRLSDNNVFKHSCSECWICGKPIFFYMYKETGKKKVF